jgi:hypothetical protein
MIQLAIKFALTTQLIQYWALTNIQQHWLYLNLYFIFALMLTNRRKKIKAFYVILKVYPSKLQHVAQQKALSIEETTIK